MHEYHELSLGHWIVGQIDQEKCKEGISDESEERSVQVGILLGCPVLLEWTGQNEEWRRRGRDNLREDTR